MEFNSQSELQVDAKYDGTCQNRCFVQHFEIMIFRRSIDPYFTLIWCMFWMKIQIKDLLNGYQVVCSGNIMKRCSDTWRWRYQSTQTPYEQNNNVRFEKWIEKLIMWLLLSIKDIFCQFWMPSIDSKIPRGITYFSNGEYYERFRILRKFNTIHFEKSDLT